MRRRPFAPTCCIPRDFIRNVNRGRIELGTFNVATEIAAAEAMLAAAKGGKDPFKGRTGDFERHYLLAGRRTR